MSYFLAFSRSHGEAVLSRYQVLRHEKLLCDVVLVAEGTEFSAHRSLLACSSDYFRSMFKSHTRESGEGVIHLHLVSAVGLQRVLDFIYNSCLSLSLDTLPQTLETARYLQVVEAVRLCSQYLISNLSLENCCDSANIADRYVLPEVQRKAELYISSHLWELLEPRAEDSGLMDLNVESMKAVLEADHIPRTKEITLLSLVLRWLNQDESRSSDAERVLSRIRYGLIQTRDLQLLCDRPDFPRRAAGEVQSLVLKAMVYHSAEKQQPILQSHQSSLRSRAREIVSVGGTTLNGGFVSFASAFDARFKTWRPISECRPVQNHCVCVLGNFLFVLGGEVLELNEGSKTARMSVINKVHRYDPRFNKWTPMANMLNKRAQFSCCVVDDSIFAMGGRCGVESSLPTTEVYDFTAGRWDKVRNLPHKIYGHASAVHNETIYISGGKYDNQLDTSKEMYSFHPLDGQWKRCPPMTIARFGHQMATVKDSIFSFVGMYEAFCDIEYFNPIQRQWHRLRPLLFDRSCYGLAVMDENIYLIGGKKWHNAQEVATQNVIVYDSTSDTWEEVCKLPLPLCGSQCAVLQLMDLPETENQFNLGSTFHFKK
ncbi:kelch-like protein 34 [Callorhinchus milii]|uniref:kelch-like protein 34 n=1 Tax=Callorhinchus milii TaxID=7868 RepID=UPI0004571917|nr:kelch-like protein 34 [Callorhinchus milii]|eukprot:gi/632971662/ref/XP_007902281.1/ PREDICTED: kelch-like protein 34 [Callorhinchus milii]